MEQPPKKDSELISSAEWNARYLAGELQTTPIFGKIDLKKINERCTTTNILDRGVKK